VRFLGLYRVRGDFTPPVAEWQMSDRDISDTYSYRLYINVCRSDFERLVTFWLESDGAIEWRTSCAAPIQSDAYDIPVSTNIENDILRPTAR
jgi:hypothetical protein